MSGAADAGGEGSTLEGKTQQIPRKTLRGADDESLSAH